MEYCKDNLRMLSMDTECTHANIMGKYVLTYVCMSSVLLKCVFVYVYAASYKYQSNNLSVI